MNTHSDHFFTPCPRGLEAVLSAELKHLGAHHICATQGGVAFRGPFNLCYQVNLHSRIASRVLWQVFYGPYRNEAEIYQATISLPWAKWFSVDQTIKVKVSAQGCPLNSLDFITLRIKDAVCDAFMKKNGVRPHVDTKSPDIQIHVFLDESHLTLYLDTSGEPLFKRGWRRAQGVAPIRENLASGILQLAGWTDDQVLLDPLCGSGTILIEAGQMAKGRKTNFQRGYMAVTGIRTPFVMHGRICKGWIWRKPLPFKSGMPSPSPLRPRTACWSRIHRMEFDRVTTRIWKSFILCWETS
jgi:putative N6-adenine-specific DNA methylase